MTIYITGPSFRANVALMAELNHRLPVVVRCVNWGESPQIAPQADDHWLVLAPKELPAFAPLPKCHYGQIDVDAPLVTQVDLVLDSLRWAAVECCAANTQQTQHGRNSKK